MRAARLTRPSPLGPAPGPCAHYPPPPPSPPYLSRRPTVSLRRDVTRPRHVTSLRSSALADPRRSPEVAEAHSPQACAWPRGRLSTSPLILRSWRWGSGAVLGPSRGVPTLDRCSLVIELFERFRTHVYTCLCMYMYIMRVHVCMCTYVHVHAHIDTCIHRL